MRSKLFLVLQIVVPAIMLPVLVLYACYELLSDYCTDEVPDTDSVFVYSVDRSFDELNRTYAKARGIVPDDETAFIDYEQIPELSTWDGVENLYIYSDTAFEDFSYRILDHETFNVAIPVDTIKYYGGPSGMFSLFGISDTSGISDGQEYVTVKCSPDGTKITQDEPDIYMYYKYDPDTWDGFIKELNEYLIEDDAVSYIQMLITSDGDSAELQQRLMRTYPASNYISAEFAEGWKSEHNRQLGLRILFVAIAIVIVTAGLEVLFGVLRKKSGAKSNPA